jgi:KaiC/GvpD/RAD55 family RecA-like ATPase
MIRSGIALIDQLCGGLRPRRSYLLTGGAGAGKTMYALQFVNQGLRSGERVMMLTHATREDLLSQADHFGIELRDALRENRALILRYRSDFAKRLVRAGSADRALDDLRRSIGEHRPRRLVIDPFAPLLEDGSASPVAAASLAELLELSQATILLTYPDDIADAYDRRLEPIVHTAAGVFRIARDERSARTIEIVSLRQPLPALTIGALAPPPTPDEAIAMAPRAGPLLLVHVSESPSEELVATLRLQHEIAMRGEEDLADVLPGAGALIVETDHATLDRARAFLRANIYDDMRAPVVVVTRFNLRSLDRARLLRDGADEVLAGDMGAPELLQRLAAALRRGHLARPPAAVHEDEGLTQLSLAGPGEMLDADRFSAALRQRAAHDDAVPFAVVRLTTQAGDAVALRALALLVVGGMRVAGGDLAALLDDSVAVYLHGAGRRDVPPFVDRLRQRRPPAAPPLRVRSAYFPSDGAAVRQLVEPLKVS